MTSVGLRSRAEKSAADPSSGTPKKSTPRKRALRKVENEPLSKNSSTRSAFLIFLAATVPLACALLAYKYGYHTSVVNSLFKPESNGAQILELRSALLHAETRLRHAEETISTLEQSQRVNAVLDEESEKPESPKRVGVLKVLPESSVFCYYDAVEHRVCHIKNLCFLPGYEQFVVVVKNSTVIEGVPSDRKSKLVELTNLARHPQMYWDYREIRQEDPRFQNLNVSYEERKTFLVNRYHAANIMHAFHDDAFNYYWLLKEFGNPSPPDSDEPFSFEHPFVYLDTFTESDAVFMIKYFSNYPIRFRPDLSKDRNLVTCFKDAVIGNSKRTAWYQYGFNGPQGPIEDKSVNGWHVREAAEFVKRRAAFFRRRNTFHLFNTSPQNPTSNIYEQAGVFDPSKHDSHEYIGIFDRLRSRIIVNKRELADALEKKFRMRVLFLRLESHPLEILLDAVGNTRVLLGMHGALLVLAAFAKPRTVLLEMYPFAVPAENYTPYKTLSNLEGVNLVYRSWVNTHIEKNIPHPEYPLALGGIQSLAPEVQEQIKSTHTVPPHKCCTDPYWLYRIYQDTVVVIPEIIEVLAEALMESNAMRDPVNVRSYLEPQPVEFVGCSSKKLEDSDQYYLDLSWTSPWNAMEPVPEKYTVNVTSLGTVAIVENKVNSKTVSVRIQPVSKGEVVLFRIQSWSNGLASDYGRKMQCEVGDYVGPAGVHVMD